MEQKMRVLPVRKDGAFCYNIILKPDFTELGEQVKTLGLEGRKLCIVADEKAGELYGEAVREELLKAAGISIRFPPARNIRLWIRYVRSIPI